LMASEKVITGTSLWGERTLGCLSLMRVAIVLLVVGDGVLLLREAILVQVVVCGGMGDRSGG
jgi:hypothetical protein